MKKKLLALILLIVITSTSFLSGCRIVITGLEENEDNTYKPTFEDGYVAPIIDFKDMQVMAHAAGQINGNVYTNSLEAFHYNYNLGTVLFELDFQLSSDGELIATHLWEDDLLGYGNSFTESNRPTLAEYENILIAGEYEGFTLQKMFDVMEDYPNTTFVIDTKDDRNGRVNVYNKLVTDALAYNPDLLDRIIPYVYDLNMKDDIDLFYEFDKYLVIYDDMNNWELTTNTQIANYVSNTDRVAGFVTSKLRISLFSDGKTDQMLNARKEIFIFTCNNSSTAKDYVENGWGIITDVFSEPQANAWLN